MAQFRRPFVKCVVYGQWGSGKSSFLATFPKPLLVLQTDPEGKETPYLRRGIGLTEHEGDFGQLVKRTHAPNAPDRTLVQVEIFGDELVDEPTAWRTFDKRFRQVIDEYKGVWASIIIDGITELEEQCRAQAEYVDLKKSADPRRWYAASAHDVSRVMRQAARLRCNVGIAAHADSDYDEVKGVRVHQPAAPGKVRTRFGSSFTEVYVAHSLVGKKSEPDKYWLQTRTDMSYAASSVLLNAPNPCAPDFKELWENFDERLWISTAPTEQMNGSADRAAETDATASQEGI